MQRPHSKAQRTQTRRKPTGYAGRYTADPTIAPAPPLVSGDAAAASHQALLSKPTAAQPLLRPPFATSSLPPSRSQSPFLFGSSSGGVSPSHTQQQQQQQHPHHHSQQSQNPTNVNAGAVRRASDAHTFGERASHLLRSAAAFQRSVDSPVVELPRAGSFESGSVPPLAPNYHTDPASPPPAFRRASSSQSVDDIHRERSSSRAFTDPLQSPLPQHKQHRRWHSHDDGGSGHPTTTITVIKGSTTVLRIVAPSSSPLRPITQLHVTPSSLLSVPPTVTSARVATTSVRDRVSPPNPAAEVMVTTSPEEPNVSVPPRRSYSPPGRSTSAPTWPPRCPAVSSSGAAAGTPMRRPSPSPPQGVPPLSHHHSHNHYLSQRSQSPAGAAWHSPMIQHPNFSPSPASYEVKQYVTLRSASPQAASSCVVPPLGGGATTSAAAAAVIGSHASLTSSPMQAMIPLSSRGAVVQKPSPRGHASSVGPDPQPLQSSVPAFSVGPLPSGGATATASYRSTLQLSWEKLCHAAAADGLTPHDLKLLSCETLRSLVSRYRIESAEELAHIEAHWALLQDDLLHVPRAMPLTQQQHHHPRHNHSLSATVAKDPGGAFASPPSTHRTPSPVLAVGWKDGAPSPLVEPVPFRSVSATRAGPSPSAVATDRVRSPSPVASWQQSLVPHGGSPPGGPPIRGNATLSMRDHGGVTLLHQPSHGEREYLGGTPLAAGGTAAAACLRFAPQEVDLKGFAQWTMQQERHQHHHGARSATPSTAAPPPSSTRPSTLEMDLSLPMELKPRARISGRRRLLSGESVARADPSVPLREDSSRPSGATASQTPGYTASQHRASTARGTGLVVPPYSTTSPPSAAGLASPPERIRCSISRQSTPSDLLFGPTFVGNTSSVCPEGSAANGSPSYRRLARAGQASPSSSSPPRTACISGLRTGIQLPNQLTLS